MGGEALGDIVRARCGSAVGGADVEADTTCRRGITKAHCEGGVGGAGIAFGDGHVIDRERGLGYAHNGKYGGLADHIAATTLTRVWRAEGDIFKGVSHISGYVVEPQWQPSQYAAAGVGEYLGGLCERALAIVQPIEKITHSYAIGRIITRLGEVQCWCGRRGRVTPAGKCDRGDALLHVAKFAVDHGDVATTCVGRIDSVGDRIDRNGGRIHPGHNGSKDVADAIDHRDGIAGIVGHIDTIGNRVDIHKPRRGARAHR